MRRFLFLTVLFAAVLLSMTGCSLWIVQRPFLDSSLSEELLDALAAELNRDVWYRDTSWTPESTVLSQTKSDHARWESRWLFGDRSIYDLLNQVDALSWEKLHPFDSHKSGTDENSLETKPTTIAASLRKDSQNRVFRFGNTSDVAEDSVSSSHLSNRYLTALAKRDDLSGWNAAIILAHRDPRNAVSIAKTLKKLVTTPPYYDPETKKRVDGPIPSFRPQRDNPKTSEDVTQEKTRDDENSDSSNDADNSKKNPQDSLTEKSKPLSEKELAKKLAKVFAPELGETSKNKYRELQAVWNRIR